MVAVPLEPPGLTLSAREEVCVVPTGATEGPRAEGAAVQWVQQV